MSGATVVWLHGVGGPPRGPGWRLLLNRQLEAQGFERVRRGGVAVVDYHPVLLGAPGRAQLTPPRPSLSGTLLARAQDAFEVRREELVEALAPWRVEPQRPGLGDLHPGVRRRVSGMVAHLPWQGFPEVRLYLDRPRRRRRVLASTLAQLPPGPLVVVAHSLGSVVAVDLLRHLRPGRLRLLVTVGSPLGLDGLVGRQTSTLEPFPHDRVGAWVNLRTHWDWITGGVPLDSRIPEVVDLPVRTDVGPRRHHWRSTYVDHPALAAAVGRGRRWE